MRGPSGQSRKPDKMRGGGFCFPGKPVNVQLLPGSTPGPRARVSITPIKFSQPGADNPGGIENSIKQLADGKTSGGPERRAFYGGDTMKRLWPEDDDFFMIGVALAAFFTFCISALYALG